MNSYHKTLNFGEFCVTLTSQHHLTDSVQQWKNNGRRCSNSFKFTLGKEVRGLNLGA